MGSTRAPGDFECFAFCHPSLIPQATNQAWCDDAPESSGWVPCLSAAQACSRRSSMPALRLGMAPSARMFSLDMAALRLAMPPEQ